MLELLHAVGAGGGHAAAEIHEAGVAARELAQQYVLRAADQRRPAWRPRARVPDEVGRRGDVDGGL